ncbi:MAG: MFS transporter [Methylococcales bacterium]
MAKSDVALPDDPLANVAVHTLYGLGGLIGLSVGILNPIISILLERRGTHHVLIGANASVFFLCVAVLAPLVGRQLRQVGLRRTLSVGLLAYAVAAILFPWLEEPMLWFGLRGLMGIGMACTMIGAQTGLSAFAGFQRRALVNGIYGLCFGVGLAVGPILGSYLYGYSIYLPFLACGVFLLQGAGLTLIGLPANRTFTANRPRMNLVPYLAIPVLAVLAYGFAEATLLSMYPVFLVHAGLSPAAVAQRLGAFVVGGLVGTLPICYFGDRFGHKRLLLCCAVAGILALCGITEGDRVAAGVNDYLAQLGVSGPSISTEIVDFAAAFSTGFSLGPVFGLALALLASVLPRADLPSGSALFTAAFSIGSAAGPGLSSWMMSRWGDAYLFVPTLMMFGLLIAAQCLMWLRKTCVSKWGSYVSRFS